MFITDFICPVLLVIACIAIIVITYYSFCIQDEIISIIGIIGTVCLILFVGIFLGVKTTENNEENQTNEIIQEEAQLKTEDIYEHLSGCTTHVAAEICDQYQNEDGTYSNVFRVDYSEIQCFIWISEQPLPDNVPYLITMDNKGTLNNPLDDEIVVVWKDMN